MPEKPIWKSQTLWGIAFLALPYGLRVVDSLFGTKIDNPEIDAFCAMLGGLMGVNGRMNVTTTLK